MMLGAVNYTTVSTPRGYVCATCAVGGVKLWREYQTFLNHQSLLCRVCAEKEQGYLLTEKIDVIGWRVPAVPTEEGDAYWGYSSVPQAGVAWWRSLPAAPSAAQGEGR